MTPSRKQRALVDFIRQMKQTAGLLKTLGEQGVKATEIPILARKAMADPCLITNPRRPTQRDLEVIYEEAL
jgi:alcohol dehydrogenase class IV